jgi:hypothetical protein
MTSLIPNGGLVCEPYLYRKKVLKIDFSQFSIANIPDISFECGWCFRRFLWTKAALCQEQDRSKYGQGRGIAQIKG